MFSIAIGDTVSNGVPAAGAGNLEVGGATDVYTFSGTAGTTVVFDTLTGGATTFRWTLVAPNSATVFNAAYGDRQATLTQTGTYTLTVSGANASTTGTYSFTLVAAPPPQLFSIAYGDTVSDGVPAAGAGNLEMQGATDVYTFSVTAGDIVIFDYLSGSPTALGWTLTAPDTTTVFNNVLGDRQTTLAQTGTYTLTLRGNGAADFGTYSFRLLLAPAPEMFSIAYGDVVSNGVPAAGAGNLEAPGAIDIYSFSVTAGETVVFDYLSGNTVQIGWTLIAPDTTTVFNNALGDRQATLMQTGTYSLRLRGNNPTGTGQYSFRLLLVPAPQSFSIAYGDTVSDGVPAAGAGNLEVPGAIDIYTFSATAGESAIFDHLSGSNALIGWTLTAPDNSVVFDAALGDRQTTFSQTGTYSLRLRSNNIDATGTYSFRLLLVPAPQSFSIAYGDTVSNGVPATGAGNLEAPGAVDTYTFSATAGQTAIFDALTGGTIFTWSLTAPDTTSVFSTFMVDQQVTLNQTGTYTLMVRGTNLTNTGTYSFALLEAGATQNFAIAFGDTVSDGVPAAGAGNLEAPGAVDVYTFSALAGQTAIFDTLTGGAFFSWSLTAPDATTLFSTFMVDQQVALSQTGTYTLRVMGTQVDNFGLYSFSLLASPALQQFVIAFGDTVSDGVPAAGAGNLEEAGAVDVYTFSATAGQFAYFDSLVGSPALFSWSLTAPDTSTIFSNFLVDQQVTLSQTGTYTLTVQGTNIDDFGVYSFALWGDIALEFTTQPPAEVTAGDAFTVALHTVSLPSMDPVAVDGLLVELFLIDDATGNVIPGFSWVRSTTSGVATYSITLIAPGTFRLRTNVPDLSPVDSDPFVVTDISTLGGGYLPPVFNAEDESTAELNAPS